MSPLHSGDRLGDPRYCRRVVRHGAAMTTAAVALIAFYLALGGGARGGAGLAAIGVAALLTVPPLLSLPSAVFATHVRRRAFFLSWSAVCVGFVTGLMLFDGGADSPMFALFLLPMMFAGLHYPPSWAGATGALGLVIYLAMGVIDAAPAQIVVLWGGLLAVASVACGVQAGVNRRHARELFALSRTDPLTGVLNRRGVLERLEAELSRARRHGEPCAVVLADVDRFKAYNDEHGHPAGDGLLRDCAQVLGATLRAGDTVGRVGGDEFLIVLTGPGLPADDADLTQSLRARVREQAPLSLGLARWSSETDSAQAVLAMADQRLYAEKRRAGRMEPWPSRPASPTPPTPAPTTSSSTPTAAPAPMPGA